MKNNTFFKLFIILIFALILRLWYIDKPEGLWNDEYVSWYIASQKDIFLLIKDIFLNCHMPLYYFLLKFWMSIFGDSDISLRISSVITSLFCIPVMYAIGKNMHSKKAGLLCAFITAISSFCIYFAQEVRLYSLLFLLSSLTIYYFIKCIQEDKKRNYIFFFIFNALLYASHTLGIIFSFFIILVLLLHIIKNAKNLNRKLSKLAEITGYFLPFIIVILILSPLLYTIAFSKSLSQFWSDFSLYKIIYTFTDYYSPVQINMSNSPSSISSYLYKDNHIVYSFVIFGIIPTLIGLISLIYSIKQKNKTLNLLILSSFMYFVALIFLSASGKMVLSTKYSIEVYPVLILTLVYGILSIKNNILKYLFLSVFISVNILYLFFSPNAAPKITREEGHLAAVSLIEYSRLKPGENVILTYYDIDKFERYIPDKNKYKFSSINKFNFNYPMFNNPDYFEVINHGKDMYKDYFKQFPNPDILEYSRFNYISKMHKGERIGILFLDNVSFFSNENIQEIVSDNKEYERTPFIFLVFSALKNSLMYSFKDDFKIDTITQSGSWTLIVYEKIH